MVLEGQSDGSRPQPETHEAGGQSETLTTVGENEICRTLILFLRRQGEDDDSNLNHLAQGRE